jgi:(p)ppGpp synthase/HD superfamily hydrolase
MIDLQVHRMHKLDGNRRFMPQGSRQPLRKVPTSMQLNDARAFAVQAHAEQKYGEHPYSYHLDAVALLATPYGAEAIAVAYLHDTVEDTDTLLTEVETRFGAKVASCVALLTDEPGANRKERKARTYAKLAQVHGPNELALIVKVADRLANVRACLQDRKEGLWRVYQSEHPAFRGAAYRNGLCEPLWVELDRLVAEGAFDTGL